MNFQKNGDDSLPGKISGQEREIFAQAYRFFEAHCDPPANQDESAVDWWMTTVQMMGDLSAKWKNHKLMDALLIAVLEYIEYKAKEKTKEFEEFVL